jgi:hypothetical protein
MASIPFGCAYGVDDAATCRALHDAACIALDEALMDVVAAARGGRPRDLAITSYLPARYAERYDLEFAKAWATAQAIVGFKLAQPFHLRLSCVAEVLVLHAIVMRAEERARALPSDSLCTERLWAALRETNPRPLFEEGPVPRPLEFDHWFEAFGDWTHLPLSPAYPPLRPAVQM